MPAKITATGEYAYKTDIQIVDSKLAEQLTRPVPMVTDKVYSTFTVGSSHFVSLPLLPRD